MVDVQVPSQISERCSQRQPRSAACTCLPLIYHCAADLQVIVPTVRASTEDRNRDGIADTLQLTLDRVVFLPSVASNKRMDRNLRRREPHSKTCCSWLCTMCSFMARWSNDFSIYTMASCGGGR